MRAIVIRFVLRTAFGLNIRKALYTWPYLRRCVTLIPMKGVAAAKVDGIRDYIHDVDRTLLRENLKLTFDQRAQKHFRALQMVEELQRAGKRLREKSDGR
jgi:hypothetical protein